MTGNTILGSNLLDVPSPRMSQQDQEQDVVHSPGTVSAFVGNFLLLAITQVPLCPGNFKLTSLLIHPCYQSYSHSTQALKTKIPYIFESNRIYDMANTGDQDRLAILDTQLSIEQ